MKVAWSLTILLTSLTGCGSGTSTPKSYGPANAAVLKPVTAGERTIRGLLYVPVYSSIYWGAGVRQDLINLTATLSVRNISLDTPVVIEAVDYFDSAGKKIRNYVPQARELGPMASVEFLVLRADLEGGPGANFVVHWSAPAGGDEPLTEAVMLGQAGSAGISFLTSGRRLSAKDKTGAAGVGSPVEDSVPRQDDRRR